MRQAGKRTWPFVGEREARALFGLALVLAALCSLADVEGCHGQVTNVYLAKVRATRYR